MPFTVAQLRTEMGQAMVASAMLTQAQVNALLVAPNVDAAVNALGTTAAQWTAYWNDLTGRIAGHGGNIQVATANAGFGLVQPPAFPPRFPIGQTHGLLILLNDCFDNTLVWMPQPNFSPVQALANHIRLLRI
jgi:hypothetical protein